MVKHQPNQTSLVIPSERPDYPVEQDVTTTYLQLEIPRSALETLAQMRGYETIEEYVTFLIAQDDEVLWDEQFAASQDLLMDMAGDALAEHEAGLTEEFDPDNDIDA